MTPYFIKRHRLNRRAFTLIELLVTISIIAILIGILLPALAAVRSSAQLAICMSNVRQMLVATQAYMLTNGGVTPAGYYNNSTSGITPKATGQPIGSPLGDGLKVWPSIGALLKPNLEGDPKKVYRCPAASSTRDDNFRISGDQPFRGTDADDVFKPNYFYMCTAQWITYGDNDAGFRANTWTAHNVANLVSVRFPSDVVVWLDESTSHHTNSIDIYIRWYDYGLGRGASDHTKDISNFGYLDGHVESQVFYNLDGYMESLGKPIPQTQFGHNFERELPSQY